MDPKQQRIALALLDGWVVRSFCRRNYLVPVDSHETRGGSWVDRIDDSPVYLLSDTFASYKHVVPPDYLHDGEALTKLILKVMRYPAGGTTWAQQQSWLEQIVTRETHVHYDSVSFRWECQNALTPWRAEATLRAFRVWVQAPLPSPPPIKHARPASDH